MYYFRLECMGPNIYKNISLCLRHEKQVVFLLKVKNDNNTPDFHLVFDRMGESNNRLLLLHFTSIIIKVFDDLKSWAFYFHAL